MSSQVLTIMLTDIQGFTAKTSASSRDALVKLLKAHEDLLLPIIGQFDGKLIKTIGDALLVTFTSPTNAVLCGLMMQQKLFEYNQARSTEDWIQIRIAINSGEVELIQGDIFGEAVNITARIEGITEANEIYFTEAVYLAMNKSEVPTSEVGSRVLKGIPDEVKVFRVIQDRESEDFKSLLHKLDGMSVAGQAVINGNKLGEVRSNAGARKLLTSLSVIAVVIFLLAGAFFIFINDPVQQAYDQVDKALAEGELDLARNSADAFIKEFPTEKAAVTAMKAVILAQAEAVFNKGHYQQAIELIDNDSRQYNLNVDEIIRPLYLKWGENTLGKIHWSKSRDLYSSILNRFPKDKEVLKNIIHVLGRVKKGWEERVLINAAISYSELVSPPYDQEHLSALLVGLNEYPDNELSNSVREIFIANPEIKELLRDKLKSSEEFPRINTYLILNERKLLTDEELLAYHTINLFMGKSRQYQKESINWINKKSQLPGWDTYNKNLIGLNFTKSAILKHANSSLLMEAHEAVIAGFLPEVMDLLVARANNKISHQDGSASDEEDRLGAYEILFKAGKIDQVDVFNFHVITLVSYAPQYRMEYFDAALQYLKDQWGKGRDDEIEKALQEGIDYTSAWINHRKSLGAKDLELSQNNLESIKTLLNELK